MSSIDIPRSISNELCDFLMLPHGSHVSRAELTRAICAYIRFSPEPGFVFTSYLPVKPCTCSEVAGRLVTCPTGEDDDNDDDDKECPFCGDEEEMEKVTINSKMNTQIWGNKLNPGGIRDLRSTTNKTCIEPDEKLSKLLHYDEYVEDIKNGKVTSAKRHKDTGQIEHVIETNTSLTYFNLQGLLAKHFV